MNDLSNLFKKIMNSESSPEEFDHFMNLLDTPEHAETIQQLMEAQLAEEIDPNKIPAAVRQRLDQGLQEILAQPKERKIRRLGFRAISIAASILIVGLATFFYINNNKPSTIHTVDPIAATINPGGNRATLTLANGNTINLSDTQSGIIIGTNEITYVGAKNLSPIVRMPNNTPTTLTLQTPNGGQYQVTLPDGTKVWLNAASTLTYPSHFSGEERRVVLSGEAYFEVAHNKKQPFIVNSEGQDVKVLGTHFNINAYPDEANIKTTLIEGSVSVSTQTNKTILTPNQQSILTNGTLTTKTINPEDYTSWKDNVFIFHGTKLPEIMKQISRWYDIQIDWKSMPDTEFYAEISRNVNLSEVLSMLEETSGLTFKIEQTKNERRITIEK